MTPTSTSKPHSKVGIAVAAIMLASQALVACGGDTSSDAARRWSIGEPLEIHAYASEASLRAMSAKGGSADNAISLELERGLGVWREAGQEETLILPYGQHFSGFWLGCGFTLGGARLQVVWLYCRDGELRHLWTADTLEAPLQLRSAVGSCTQDGAYSTQSFALPDLALTPPRREVGFFLRSTDVDLGPPRADGTSGRVRHGGRWMPAWVFTIIDCTACAGAGWWELHALVYDPERRRVLSEIYYLDRAITTKAQSSWGFWLPDLAPVPAVEVAAEWTVTKPPG